MPQSVLRGGAVSRGGLGSASGPHLDNATLWPAVVELRQTRSDLREVPEPRVALRRITLKPTQRRLSYFGDPRSA